MNLYKTTKTKTKMNLNKLVEIAEKNGKEYLKKRKTKMTNQEVKNQIAWSRKRQIKRLELKFKLQQDLGNLGRAEILKDKIIKLQQKQ
jgi:hypothetical protein|tara:strand:- start:250 stop:513 length:264 start_codon:yes stop_codon:yes gene_type:complete